MRRKRGADALVFERLCYTTCRWPLREISTYLVVFEERTEALGSC